jgi:hypothetical protein
MTAAGVNTDKQQLANKLEQELMDRYGLMVGGQDLRIVLGYNTASAFNLAFKLGDISLPIFNIEKRRGKFALSTDIAHWIASQKFKKL